MKVGHGSDRVSETKHTTVPLEGTEFDDRTYDGLVHAKCCRTSVLSADGSYAGTLEHCPLSGLSKESRCRRRRGVLSSASCPQNSFGTPLLEPAKQKIGAQLKRNCSTSALATDPASARKTAITSRHTTLVAILSRATDIPKMSEKTKRRLLQQQAKRRSFYGQFFC